MELTLTHSRVLTPQAPPMIPPVAIKFVTLHFTGATFPGNNRLEVNLGYDVDIFNSASGTEFWTCPINVRILAGGQIPIQYIVNGGAVSNL